MRTLQDKQDRWIDAYYCMAAVLPENGIITNTVINITKYGEI